MAYKSRPCAYGCDQPYVASKSSDRGHAACRNARLQEVIPSFEPQADPGEQWTGRPFADERNKWRMPPYNLGVPVRDILANPIRIAVMDVETTGLNAAYGRVLCGVTRLFGPDELRVRRADQYEPWKKGQRSNDSEVVKAILMDLEEADIVIGHNSVNFDWPFLRTRALVYNFPAVNPKKIIDPVMIARRTFRFHSNRLDAINRTLKTEIQKTEIDPDVWASAWADHDGSEVAAMNLVVEHCINDVDSLCEDARRFAPYIRSIDALGSFRQ